MNNARTIEIEGRDAVRSLLFLEDGKHLLSCGLDGMIRQWSIEDGREVGEPIKGNERVWALALSSDRKWIVSGEVKFASVWNRHTWQKVLTVREHTLGVLAVDISPDSTTFVTGGTDKKVFIWDILTGRRLIGPLEHDNIVSVVKFSPDGDHIATATWNRESLRIYNARSGQLIKTIPVCVRGYSAVAWSSDSQRIFVSSLNHIKHFFVDTGSIISEWTILGETDNTQGSLAVPGNGRFIACFVGSSLSLLDTSTGQRFGPVFNHPGQRLQSIALSPDNTHLATSGENGIITLRNLNDIIPMHYLVERPQNRNGANLTLQIETFCGVLRALESRLEELDSAATQPNDFSRAQATPLHVPDGTYRIKSYISDLYLACPQDSEGMVVVQQLDPSSDFQRWRVCHVEDGGCSIVCHGGGSDVLLSTGDGSELICVPDGNSTTWTIEPRGHSYVIGNIANATAIHLTQRTRHVWAFLRDNSQNQRWIFERV